LQIASGYFVGRVEAKDPDKGKNGRVFYYIVSGNDGKWFSVDKTYGNIYTKQKLGKLISFLPEIWAWLKF
jgi:hypothetical protein